MLTMNRATLVGHAGRNPEMRTLPSGDEVALFSLATTERFKRRDGSDGEATEWHAIVAFGAAAEAVRKLVRRGDPVLVEGRIGTRTWTDRKGAEHRTSEIVVSGPRGQVNVLAKRRPGQSCRRPDGGDGSPGGAAPAGAAKAADAERNEGTADAVAAATSDRTADTGTDEDAGPGSGGDASAVADTDGRAETSQADRSAGGTPNGDSPKGSDADAGSGSGDNGAAATGGANTVEKDETDSGAHADTGHGGGDVDAAGPPEDASAAEAASAGTESDTAAADTDGRTETSQADRAAGGMSNGDSPKDSDAGARTGEAEGAEAGDGGGAVAAGAVGRPGDTGHE